MKKKLRMLAAALILLGTLAAFVRYTQTHPALLERLRDTNPVLMIFLIFCYIGWFLALVIILRVSLRLYAKTMPRKENILLNSYSTLVNFFGPGQSGPALRGLYLKKRHGLPIKSYIFATLLYYAFYAVISAFYVCAGSQAWWVTALLVMVAAGACWLIIRWYANRSKLKKMPGMNMRNLSLLFSATAVQLVIQAFIFYLELRSVSDSVSVAQTLTYTGAANFALFVSLTPGAIGIREAFLVFSQGLHHISDTVIVAANVIDRAIYLIFLGLLFIMTIALHAKDTLRIKRYTTDSSS